MRPLLLLALLVGCAPNDPNRAQLVVDSSDVVSVERGLSGLTPRFDFVPVATGGHSLTVTRDASLCSECYRLNRDELRVTLTAGGELGLQYGIAHWLESLGYGFFHPFHTREPESFPKSSSLVSGEFTPDIARRGLHLHTLHPIEPVFDFWVPSDAHFENATKTIDWLIRNRGDYLQWAGLDDIRKDANTATAWRAHTIRIIDYAHQRGVETGLTVQLFDNASLQQSFTLIDAARPDDEAALTERLRIVMDGVPFDNLNVSFGEFFASNPQAFIDKVDTTQRLINALRPDGARRRYA